MVLWPRSASLLLPGLEGGLVRGGVVVVAVGGVGVVRVVGAAPVAQNDARPDGIGRPTPSLYQAHIFMPPSDPL